MEQDRRALRMAGRAKVRSLETAFRIGRYHAWWVLLAMFLITGFGIYYVRDIPLRSSFLELLPKHDPLIDDYKRNEQYAAQSDYVAILLTLSENLPFEERKGVLMRAAEEIASRLRDDPEFMTVTYLQEVSPEIPDEYLQLFQLNERLTSEELVQIERSVALAREAIASGDEELTISSSSLATAYRDAGAAIAAALVGFEASSIAGGEDVAGLSRQLETFVSLNGAALHTLNRLDELPAIADAVTSLAAVFDAELSPEAREPVPYLSPDRTAMLMVVQPRYAAQRGVEYSTLVTDKIDAAIAASDAASLGVRTGVAGNYPYNKETNEVINRDMLRTTIISAIGVFVIFMLAFGSIFYSIIGLLPLLISVLLTMCWAKFAVNGFNLVTTFLPSLVLGLGIDYAIHMIARYAEERSKGQSLNRALHAAVRLKGEASMAAALTTALVFFGLLTSRSSALFEMGVISGVGVLIAFLVTLLLIPALITVSHYVLRFRHRETVANHAARLTGFFRFLTDKSRAVLVIVLVLTFFITFQAARTKFVFSSNDLVPRVKTMDVLEEIQAKFDVSPAGLGSFFTFYVDTEQEMRNVVGRLQGNPLVEHVESAVGLLPVNLTEQQQALTGLDIDAYIRQLDALERSLGERSDVLTQIRTLLAQFALIQYGASFTGEVGMAMSSHTVVWQLREMQQLLTGLDTQAATGNVRALRDALARLDGNLARVRDLPPIETLLRDILQAYPEEIRSRYLSRDGQFVVKARVSSAVYDGDNLHEFDQFAASLGAKDYFGMPLVAKALEGYMKRDFFLSTGIAAVLILFVLWRTMRGWFRALVAASPLLLGYIWMLGGMRMLSIDFNFLSIVISPLLIGIGVDNGIHILHRVMEERAVNPVGAVERAVGVTAVAAIVTSLTTMLAFGALLAARTPGLRLLGMTALLGIGFALVFSLVFLPAALHVEGGKRV